MTALVVVAVLVAIGVIIWLDNNEKNREKDD